MRIRATPAADGAPAPTLRLNKRMADLGLGCAARPMPGLPRAGCAAVGAPAVMGQPVAANARIDVAREAEQQQRQQVTILINSLSATSAARPKTATSPPWRWCSRKIRWRECTAACAGAFTTARRVWLKGFDIDSIGLLVLTQDGRVARQIIGEDSGIEKEYLVRVSYGPETLNVQSVFPPEKLALLRHGLSLDGQNSRSAQVDWQNPEQLRFVLRQGKSARFAACASRSGCS